MIGAVIVGVLSAAGLGLLALYFFPPRHDLVAAVGRWEVSQVAASRSDPTTYSAEVAGLTARFASLAARLTRELRRRGVTFERLSSDLAVLDRTLDEHMTRKVMTAAAGLFVTVPAYVLLREIGLQINVLAFVGLTAAVAAVLFIAPDAELRKAAERRRSDMRAALACFLQLVSLSLSAGRGVNDATKAAAKAGDGWAFTTIDDAIYRAERSGRSMWMTFAELGDKLGVIELRDLGNSLQLVAQDGAKVRDSLQARAATQRRRQLEELAGEGKNADQSIAAAQILVVVGFLAFLVLASVMNIMNLAV